MGHSSLYERIVKLARPPAFNRRATARQFALKNGKTCSLGVARTLDVRRCGFERGDSAC
jgi:hypothetical protein